MQPSAGAFTSVRDRKAQAPIRGDSLIARAAAASSLGAPPPDAEMVRELERALDEVHQFLRSPYARRLGRLDLALARRHAAALHAFQTRRSLPVDAPDGHVARALLRWFTSRLREGRIDRQLIEHQWFSLLACLGGIEMPAVCLDSLLSGATSAISELAAGGEPALLASTVQGIFCVPDDAQRVEARRTPAALDNLALLVDRSFESPALAAALAGLRRPGRRDLGRDIRVFQRERIRQWVHRTHAGPLRDMAAQLTRITLANLSPFNLESFKHWAEAIGPYFVGSLSSGQPQAPVAVVTGAWSALGDRLQQPSTSTGLAEGGEMDIIGLMISAFVALGGLGTSAQWQVLLACLEDQLNRLRAQRVGLDPSAEVVRQVAPGFLPALERGAQTLRRLGGGDQLGPTSAPGATCRALLACLAEGREDFPSLLDAWERAPGEDPLASLHVLVQAAARGLSPQDFAGVRMRLLSGGLPNSLAEGSLPQASGAGEGKALRDAKGIPSAWRSASAATTVLTEYLCLVDAYVAGFTPAYWAAGGDEPGEWSAPARRRLARVLEAEISFWARASSGGEGDLASRIARFGAAPVDGPGEAPDIRAALVVQHLERHRPR